MFEYGDGVSFGALVSAPDIVQDEWQYVVLTVDLGSDTVHVYLNGEEVISSTSMDVDFNTSGAWTIGAFMFLVLPSFADASTTRPSFFSGTITAVHGSTLTVSMPVVSQERGWRYGVSAVRTAMRSAPSVASVSVAVPRGQKDVEFTVGQKLFVLGTYDSLKKEIRAENLLPIRKNLR